MVWEAAFSWEALTRYLFACSVLTRLFAVLALSVAVAGSARGNESRPSAPLTLDRVILRLAPDYYSGDRRLLASEQPGARRAPSLSQPPARERDRLQRALAAALDVTDVLAERAGDVAGVGSMPLLVPIAREATPIALDNGKAWIVFATLVRLETSGKHLTTASVAASVEPEGSIVVLRSWSGAYGPATLNQVMIVRLCPRLSAKAAAEGQLALLSQGVNGRQQLVHYDVSATSRAFVRRPARAENGPSHPASCR